jgi:hypothetical protein
MRLLLAAVLLGAASGAAFAQYKCVAAGGAVTFQQTPCPRGQQEQALDLHPNGGPRAEGAPAPRAIASGASAPDPNVDKRLLARYQRQDRIDALDRQVRAAQEDADRRQAQKANEVAAIRGLYQRTGADGRPSAPGDMAAALRAVDDKYRAFDQLDRERLAAAQAAATKARAQPVP